VCLELAGAELFGDVPVLVREVGGYVGALWAALVAAGDGAAAAGAGAPATPAAAPKWSGNSDGDFM
jgi:hypothetical protein